MAEDKGKSILTAPPMNSSSSSPWPFGEPHGCDGDGCASDLDTWPIHNVYRRGERSRRLCCSCILLSDRSLYCCCCFFIVSSPSSSSQSHHDDGDPLLAPPAPTVTCLVCRSAVAHLACLYAADDDGSAFVCPACRAAKEGTPFTYASPCGEPLDARASRVILLGSRMALALLRREAAAARAAADRMAREADEARMRAHRALRVAFDLDTQLPSWNSNVRPLAPEEQAGSETDEGSSQADVEETLLVRRRAMPPHLAPPTMGTAAAAMAHAASIHAPPQWSSWSLPPFGASSEVTVAAAESSSRANPTLNLFGVKEMAMAAAEAARASPPRAPRTLQLFPARNGKARARARARASPKMPRTLQLFEDKIPDADEEGM
ncbi:unnamed protein product [Urochloa decumbens]|uniref:Zinc finger PHD-type domain-containing protein n=1 Tax=Urochloa decumbens TaxID=240449 RepID=A0ABC8ZSD7_9POAL